MRPSPFALERYFAAHEFTAPYLLSCSDCDGLSMSELLSLADEECRGLWDGLRLGYTDSRGLPALRAQIAAQYEGIDAGQVLVGAPEELLFVAMNALLRPGDHVVCVAPAYQSLHEVARAIGCAVDLWQVRETAEGWHFDLQELAHLIEGARLLVVNFPHNPTGALPGHGDYRAMLELAADAGVRVFSDEMYRGLERDPADRLPAACDVATEAVSLSGMSKVYGMAGARIGWLATQDGELLERMAAFKDYTTICSCAPGELLSLVGLRAHDAIVERHRTRIEANLDALRAFLGRNPGLFSLVEPRAGTVCLLQLLEGSASDLSQRAVDEAGILLVPSTLFDFGDRHLRIGLGRSDMPSVLARFEAWLGQPV